MAITNKDGFDFLNTLLRKEINGSPITTDRFNNLLNICFEEKISDEYTKFEGNQKNTDFFRYLKKGDIITVDGDGYFNLDTLRYNYFHITSAYYYDTSSNVIDIDQLTDEEWSARLSSSLESPTEDFPVFKIIDNKLQFFPLALDGDDNLIENGGFDGTTDWDITGGGTLADNWSVDRYSNGTSQSTVPGNLGFSSIAQGFSMDNGTGSGAVNYSTATLPTVPNGKYSISFDYAITDYGGNTIIDVVLNGFVVGTTPSATSVLDKKTFTLFIDAQYVATTPSLEFIGRNDEIIYPLKTVFLDKVYLGEALEITVNYLKQPTTPYFDWYYDANDRIQYLSEGEVYTLQTGETYIDKVDGSVLTATDVIGSIANGDDADNKTVEMEIPDDDKRGVWYSMLSKLGVSIDQLDATQYSIQMEQKEAGK